MVKTVNASPLICALKGTFTSLILSLVIMPVTAWILISTEDPESFIFVVPKAIQIITALIGGIVAARCRGSKGLITAFLSGAIYSTVIIIGGIAAKAQTLTMIIMIILICVISVLGGIIGIPKEKSAGAKRREMIKKLNR